MCLIQVKMGCVLKNLQRTCLQWRWKSYRRVCSVSVMHIKMATEDTYALCADWFLFPKRINRIKWPQNGKSFSWIFAGNSMLKRDGRWRGEAVEGKRLAIETLSNCRVLRNCGVLGRACVFQLRGCNNVLPHTLEMRPKSWFVLWWKGQEPEVEYCWCIQPCNI